MATRIIVFEIPASPTEDELFALRFAKQAEDTLRASGLLVEIPAMSDVTIKIVENNA